MKRLVRRRVWRRASRVRGRLLVLAFLAAIPITILGCVIAWQEFRAQIRAIEDGSAVIAGRADSQFTLTTLATVHRLQRLSSTPDACERLRTEVTQGGEFSGFALSDPDGKLLCQGPGNVEAFLGGEERPAPWFEQVRGGANFALGHSPQGRRTIFATATNRGDILAVLLPANWARDTLLPAFNPDDGATWVVDRTGAVVASQGDVAAALPDPAVDLIDGAAAPAVATGRSGRLYSYAVLPLDEGRHLIVARQAQAERARARHVLAVRLGQLCFLMVSSVAAVVVGADLAFGRPIRRLRTAVERWHGGGGFAPGPLHGAPDEVLDLARSFQAATESLHRQSVSLAKAKEQGDLLVLEIHHRVKNNLQVIASLLNLQASRIRVPEAKAEFQAARDRVRALATLHRHLYSEGELHAINMRSFLFELCGQLFQAMGEVAGDRIALSIEAPELRLSADQAVPLALIVTEAVTNSVKYAFPDGRRGSVSVRVVEADGTVDLVISDDGVGIPPGRAETEAGTRDGLGRQLMRGFARQLGGTLQVEEGDGTTYRVRTRLQPAKAESEPAKLDAFRPARDSVA